MTDKQRNKVSVMAHEILRALDSGCKVIDERGHEVLGLRYNARMNPNSWCYLYDGDTGHLVHGLIKYKVKKTVPVSMKFKVLHPGKKAVVIK